MDSPENFNSTMNPRITSIIIGTRDCEEIKLYPLSLGQQMDLEELIQQFLSEYFGANPDGGDTVGMLSFVLGFIKDNIFKILGYITDFEGDELTKKIKSMDNYQLTQIIGKILEVNYTDPYEKNLKSLPLVKKLFQLGRQFVSLSEDSLSTESTMSTENLSKTADLLSDSLNSSLLKPRRTT